MLFLKLYNWLKYKTFPTSFLFKNRLFIERDSKHRKVMNNFGLIFRNSKWNNYENANVNADFKNIYLKFAFKIIFFIFFFYLLCFLNFTNNFFFSSLSFFFWFTLDSLDYYTSFVIWSFFSFLSISLSKFYLFINKYDKLDSKENPSSLLKKINFHNVSSNPSIFLSKSDLNWILYAWLSNDNSFSKYNVKCIELLFDSNVSKKLWNDTYGFYMDLFKAVFFLNLHNNDFYSYRNLLKNLNNSRFSSIFVFFENTDLFKNYFNFILSFYFKNKTNSYFLTKKTKSTVEDSKWILDSSFLEKSKSNNVFLKSALGSFFFNNISFIETLNNLTYKNSSNFLFKNLLIINSVTSSVNFAKWNRWLYRYSLLHRKSLKFSQKLIFTKKLMNTGFYNSSIFKKNLWNSVYFSSKNLKSHHMTTFFDSYFNDFMSINYNKNFFVKSLQNTFVFDDKNNFLFFKFFETSYFWHLKRFFLFNALNKNNSFIKINLKKTNLFDYFNNSNPYFNIFYFNFFIKNRTFFLQPLLISPFTFLALKKNSEHSDDFFLNDFFLSTTDLDVFSKGNLSLLSILSSNNSLSFFFNNSSDFFYMSGFLKSNFIKSSFNRKDNFFFDFFFNQLINSKNDLLAFKDLFIFQSYFK